MSGFHLVPVEGGEPIHLPPGETVIGRGPLLRVGDKRVSRHHGLLENLNGRLRLKATHVNPCFVRSSLSDDPRPLQKDCWFPLEDGDLISLLPAQLIFRVEAGDHGSSRNGQKTEEQLPASPIEGVETLPAPPPPGAQTPPPEEPAEAPPPQQDQGDQRSADPPRQRVLPAWMMAHRGSSSFSPKDQPAGASRSRGAEKKSKMASAEEQEEERGEEERPRKRRKEVPERSTAEEEGGAEEEEGGAEEEEGGAEEEEGGAEEEEGGAEEEEGGAEEEEGGAEPDASSASQPEDSKLDKTQTESWSSSRPRRPCPYGKQCYRKNPAHFQESSHPGDADYQEDEDEDEDKPECPYGTDCYRKNPLHRKEYNHTKRPGYNTRPRPKAAAREDMEDEDEDSFINDDSGDGGDDSDYAPPDSEDSGKEDIRRLQEEAQAFLRKRK